MTIKIESGAPQAVAGDRNAFEAIRRGLAQTCPACGKGRLYTSFLKVADRCPACGEELFHQRADDAPPYFTMLILGHVLVAGVLALERFAAPPMWVHMVVWLPATVLLSLFLLPRVKGGLIGLQWAFRMHGFGAGPDPAAPDIDHPALRKAGEAGL